MIVYNFQVVLIYIHSDVISSYHIYASCFFRHNVRQAAQLFIIVTLLF